MAASIRHWQEIIGFRNLLIHGYAAIDDGRVWRVVQINLPALAVRVDAMLASRC
jgi:uncharacterized protein with HEPN domain